MNCLKSYVIFLLISILFTACQTDTSQKSDTKEPTRITDIKEKNSKKKYPSANITANSEISSPIEITVNSEGIWFGFEAELGTVTLVSTAGEELGIGILGTKEDWMVESPVNYNCSLNYKATEAGKGKLVFKNNNPSDNREHDKFFEIPVSYTKSL